MCQGRPVPAQFGDPVDTPGPEIAQLTPGQQGPHPQDLRLWHRVRPQNRDDEQQGERRVDGARGLRGQKLLGEVRRLQLGDHLVGGLDEEVTV